MILRRHYRIKQLKFAFNGYHSLPFKNRLSQQREYLLVFNNQKIIKRLKVNTINMEWCNLSRVLIAFDSYYILNFTFRYTIFFIENTESQYAYLSELTHKINFWLLCLKNNFFLETSRLRSASIRLKKCSLPNIEHFWLMRSFVTPL